MFVYKGDGTFNDRVPFSFPKINSAAALVDVNNDGKADLEIYETYSGNARLDAFLNNGDGTFATVESSYPLGAGACTAVTPLVTGDFAANGLQGFAAMTSGDANVSVITATCKP